MKLRLLFHGLFVSRLLTDLFKKSLPKMFQTKQCDRNKYRNATDLLSLNLKMSHLSRFGLLIGRRLNFAKSENINRGTACCRIFPQVFLQNLTETMFRYRTKEIGSKSSFSTIRIILTLSM